ncbi:MAG: hypothetical protein CMN30_24745 [Sandaracinus sp.]|nr:hypothetical protein [Sandaracinus sp.]|tara:strand:+ start:78 stop:1046 length:969 start_codon:yes stop_codon:yes gene_type:complete
MLARRQDHPRAVFAVAIGAVVLSLLLVAALTTVYVLYGSQLALSQAADSFADTLTQVALVVSLFIARQPPDAEHHYGHQRAEPIAALVASVMIGVVSIEVIREAITAIFAGHAPAMHWSLPLIFGIKGLTKVVMGVVCWRIDPSEDPNPVLRAIYVDARNDAVLSILSVVGYFGAKYGASSVDAYLAIPIGLWIGWSAIDLAQDTVPLLMGQAPSPERQAELEEVVCAIDGVREVRRMRIQHVGVELDLDVHVYVDPDLSLREAHAIGRAVERRLIEEDDVTHAMVHMEPEGETPSSLMGESLSGATVPSHHHGSEKQAAEG